MTGGHRRPRKSSARREPSGRGRCRHSGGVELNRVGEIDDAAAAGLAREGDPDAYEVLVVRYTASAHRFAVLLGAGEDADDVVQEAFVKAYRQISRYRGDSGFRPWLFSIVANETRNLHRSRKRRDGLALRAAAVEETGVTGPDPAEVTLAVERRRQLVEQVRRLDFREREVLVCRYFLDLSEAETAQALSIPKGTVKSRTSRALARLRDRLAVEVTGA
ncbi:RNA polymerase sigma factor [Actinoplanes sp. NPDC051346]|uniref:RNA polymerase sigma factor n=1 Tax=Actinoplanes sp. NPDC051346 TaxID=3155048 RepID=UPI0034480CD6